MAHDRSCSGCLSADEQTRITYLKVVKTDYWLDPPTHSKEWGTKLNSMFSWFFFFFGPNVYKCTFHFSDLYLRTTMLDYGSLLYLSSLHIKKNTVEDILRQFHCLLQCLLPLATNYICYFLPFLVYHGLCKSWDGLSISLVL